MLIWVLDYMTHINSYPRPISPELAVFIVAEDDMYVPRGGLTDVRELWPGRYIATVIIFIIACLYMYRMLSYKLRK